MVGFDGRYIHEKSENYDAYLKELGVPVDPERIESGGHTTMEIKTIGDKEFEINATGTHGNMSCKVKEGTPVDVTRPDGLQVTLVLTDVGENSLKYSITPKACPSKVTETEVTFANDGLIQTLKLGNVVCKRHFKLQK